MAILLNDNIQIEAGKHVDNKYGPYNDLASVLTSIPSFKRARGLTVGVIEGGLLKEYWFKEGTNNSDLVEKITSASSGGNTFNLEIKSDFVNNSSYTGLAAKNSSDSSNTWTIRKTTYSTLGSVLSTLSATNISWNNRLTI